MPPVESAFDCDGHCAGLLVGGGTLGHSGGQRVGRLQLLQTAEPDVNDDVQEPRLDGGSSSR
jgi:hypothetical protein